jgi:hypothetical protein
LTGPTSGLFTAGQTVSIQWNAGNEGAGSKISLCYDPDTTWWDGNEHWIEIDQVAAANGSGSYTWDTTGVRPGTYFVAGYLWSGAKPYISQIMQPITIQAGKPTISQVVIVPAQGLMTWNIQDAEGVASTSLTVDGSPVTKIYGPYAAATGANYAGIFGILTAGNHPYTITATDSVGNVSQLSGTIDVQALYVSATTKPLATPAVVTDGQLAPIVSEAKQRLESVYGDRVVVAMAGVTIQVADLPGGLLGEEIGKTILIDRDAEGYGWFIDPTPGDDSEFAPTADPDVLKAPDTSPAAQRIDLLTAVMHEMGHELGFADDAAGDLMNATLSAGVRRTLAVDHAVANLYDT